MAHSPGTRKGRGRSSYQNLRGQMEGDGPRQELWSSVAGAEGGRRGHGSESPRVTLLKSFTGDSQSEEPDGKSIQVSLPGQRGGGEWCNVDLEGPGKLASHPPASTTTTQPILSTSFLLPETLLSYRLALLLSGGLTSLSPLPRFLFSHPLLSTCPSLPSNAFPWPYMVLQPLSCLNAQLTAHFHFLEILCFTSYGTLAASQSPTNFSAHGDLAFA